MISHENVDKIDDGIIVNIRESRFMVTDFTEQKQNVYYEAGFARGFGIRVISLCAEQEIDEKKLHFDTRQYKHIPWKTDQLEEGSEELKELRRTLGQHVIESVGRGLNKPEDVLAELSKRPRS